MSQLADIQRLALDAGVKLIVIGGLAVCEHGYSRRTEDLDALVCSADRLRWEALLRASGYTLFSEKPAFSQWEPKPESIAARLDIMYVNEQTFEKLWGGSIERCIGDVCARIPSLDHLLALKLHAAKSAPWRMLRDMADIIALIDANQVDVTSESFRELCVKFGSQEMYEQLRGTH